MSAAVGVILLSAALFHLLILFDNMPMATWPIYETLPEILSASPESAAY